MGNGETVTKSSRSKKWPFPSLNQRATKNPRRATNAQVWATPSAARLSYIGQLVVSPCKTVMLVGRSN